MERIPVGPLGLIIQFCPIELKSVSKRLESAQLTYVLSLIEKLARENLDLFPYLKGFRDCNVREEQNGSSTIKHILKKVVADTKSLASILYGKSPTNSEVYHLIGGSDTSKILGGPKQTLDHSLQIFAGVLRERLNHLPIPQGPPETIRAWFADEGHHGILLRIRTLNLSNLGLRVIPDEIGNLGQLKHLKLDNNHLTSLPVSIGSLKRLKELNLSNNQFTTLPEFIGRLKAIRYLYLSNNQLTNLPESIYRLRGLYGIYLYNNQLTTLQELYRKNKRNYIAIECIKEIGKIIITVVAAIAIIACLDNIYKSSE